MLHNLKTCISHCFLYNGGMTNYRRAKFEGGFYFFTVVTYKRRKFLTSSLARRCLRQSFQAIRQKRHFDIVAICLLPDHLHCIWKLPDGDCDFSYRWSAIKSQFTSKFLGAKSSEISQSLSREKKRERGIWQRRFWEHQIRDEKDLQEHLDYIHYNPVKHKLVKELEDWPWSTYHKYVHDGIYLQKDWEDLQKDFDGILAGE